MIKSSGSIGVVGSTGVIGSIALRIAKKQGIRVNALTANSNLELLKAQVDEFKPDMIGVTDPSKYKQAKQLFGDKLLMGADALTVPAAHAKTDTVVVSVVGYSGIHTVIEAIKNGKRIALANKESLVAGGSLVKSALMQNPAAKILPVDSEHSAVFQCLMAGKSKEIDKIILTASGGAFYNYTLEQLHKITPKDIFHPNWSMGRKITIDSCTMINKALEIIEAYWLFGTDRIDYVVHPESIIHSIVNFKDGTSVAQLAPPDMSLPVQYALSYPNRTPCINSFEFDRPLTFLKKNPLFYAPELAKQVIAVGKSAGAVLNAAAEQAVQLFENGDILFTDIVNIVKKYLFMSDIVPINSIDDIIYLHNETTQKIKRDYKILRSN